MSRPIEYIVSLEAPQTQTFQVHMRIRGVASETLDVALPVWRQGKYAVINPAGSIRSVLAESASGGSLPIAKTDKTTWRIETGGASEVLVRYTVYANSLNDRTRHVDDTHAFLSGSTVFLYVPGRRNDPVTIRLDAPADWQVACSLQHEDGDPRTLTASSYDVLIDSPIEIGVHERLTFLAEGKPHEVVVWGGIPFDSYRLEQDLTNIIGIESAIFGGLPYDRYIFIFHVGPGLRGGTEHLNSTVIQMTPRAFEDESQYKILLSVAAHELFHAWNVKRLRPAVLANVDLAKENYTSLLWFCEGMTSYYDELVLARAGLEPVESYLKTLAEAIYQNRARPGSQVQSVAESSFDAWIKFNQASPDDVNATVSFYESGALVSLLLDLEMRKRSANLSSLDTLVREMYLNFPSSGPGFTTQDLIATAERLTDSGFGDFFARYVQGTERYPFEEMFGTVGLEMIPQDTSPHPYSGLLLQDEGNSCMVRSVLSDGPAYLAGVNPGDEIVSLNGRRFKAADLIAYVDRQLAPEDAVWLQVLRRNHLRRIEFKLGKKPNPRWRLQKVSSPSPAQQSAYASWLGGTFPNGR